MAHLRNLSPPFHSFTALGSEILLSSSLSSCSEMFMSTDNNLCSLPRVVSDRRELVLV